MKKTILVVAMGFTLAFCNTPSETTESTTDSSAMMSPSGTTSPTSDTSRTMPDTTRSMPDTTRPKPDSIP